MLLAAIALALAIGLLRAATDGRFRGTHRVKGGSAPARDRPGAAEPVPDAPAPAAGAVTEVGAVLGERATLLQFSSAFCAPCRATRRVLGDVAASVDGVAHVEVDAEHHLEVVRRLGVVRTPTTLVLDAAGREVARATGAPRKEQVLAAVAQAVSP